MKISKCKNVDLFKDVTNPHTKKVIIFHPVYHHGLAQTTRLCLMNSIIKAYLHFDRMGLDFHTGEKLSASVLSGNIYSDQELNRTLSFSAKEGYLVFTKGNFAKTRRINLTDKGRDFFNNGFAVDITACSDNDSIKVCVITALCESYFKYLPSKKDISLVTGWDLKSFNYKRGNEGKQILRDWERGKRILGGGGLNVMGGFFDQPRKSLDVFDRAAES